MARFGILAALALGALVAAPLPGSGGAPDNAVPSGAERSAGSLVFVFRSSRLAAVDVATGRRTVRRVPALASCGPELHVTGGHVIFGGVRRGRTVVYSAPVSLDRAPTRLGGAHAFVPSATEGRVWLAGVDCSRPEMVGVREIGVDGQVTQESGRRVPGTWLEGAVEDGLVILSRRRVAVWNPRSGDLRRLPLAGASDAHRTRLVGCALGPRCRRLLILDTGAGTKVLARPPRHYTFDYGAEFSPDGALIAAPVVSGRRWRVALVDARDGRSSLVPGSRTGRIYPWPNWSASSGRLFFQAGDRRIKAYRPGERRARTLPFRVPRNALAFLAG
jgi:hypothetical protein